MQKQPFLTECACLHMPQAVSGTFSSPRRFSGCYSLSSSSALSASASPEPRSGQVPTGSANLRGDCRPRFSRQACTRTCTHGHVSAACTCGCTHTCMCAHTCTHTCVHKARTHSSLLLLLIFSLSPWTSSQAQSSPMTRPSSPDLTRCGSRRHLGVRGWGGPHLPVWPPTARTWTRSLHGWQCRERCRLSPGFSVTCVLKNFPVHSEEKQKGGFHELRPGCCYH